MAILGLLVIAVAITSSVAAEKRQESGASDITYKQFHVDSLIVSRYAVTTVTSVVRNDADESKELDFRVQLPDTAFISNFSMSVNGKTYYGIAKEKEEAAKEFEERISAGENAGLVESRGTDVFSVRINTAANSEATFVLQYEELIMRRRSKYQQVLNLNPGAVVDDLAVNVRVSELQNVINQVASQFVTTEKVSDSEVLFSYSPSVEQQQEDSVEFGLARDMTVEYDVVHPVNTTGEFVVDRNCYFAQFFSPPGVASVPVDLVFVIDVSGSMRGTKIEQTRQALETIINQLRPTDRFTMVLFSTSVSYWQETLVSVSEYRLQAIQFARELQADGSTNFNAGLLAGASIVKGSGRDDHVPLLVILTDGQPTVGVTSESAIVENAANALAGTSISLNCLGFGFDLNFNLLERLALQNNGIVRRIYEGEDAPQQLEGFFEEISSPVLRDIRILYDEQYVQSISTTEFPLLFDGGEIVVAGQLLCDESDPVINVEVTGKGGDGPVTYVSEVSTSPTNTAGGYSPSTERLLAYLMIQQLLESRFTLTDEAAISANVEQALQLSLEYNFVTELTSLIVVEESADGSGTRNESIIGGENEGDREDGEYPGLSLPTTGFDYDAGGNADGGDYAFEGSGSRRCDVLAVVMLLLQIIFMILH
jgi:uncharacterized protein YegL